MNDLDSYYETLGELLTAVSVAYDEIIPIFYGGIGYGETHRMHIETAGRKTLHVIVTRMDTGRYELVSYRL